MIKTCLILGQLALQGLSWDNPKPYLPCVSLYDSVKPIVVASQCKIDPKLKGCENG